MKMRLITEDVVKRIVKAGKWIHSGTLYLPADCLLTPSAKAAVIDFKVGLVIGKKPQRDMPGSIAEETPMPKTFPKHAEDLMLSPVTDTSAGAGDAKRRYQVEGGDMLDEKPEHLTHLKGTILVPKGDARIRLRGEVDVLIAELLKTQRRCAALGCEQLVDDLQEVYAYIGELSRAEVLEEPFTAERIIGLSYQEVREISHHPHHYFGRGHLFTLSYDEGELTVLLNALRAYARRCELVFYEAFKTDDGAVARPDLMEGYNRLSSVLYLLCLRAVTGKYGDLT